MSFFINITNMSLVNCIKRILPVVKSKNIVIKNVLNQPKIFFKSEHNTLKPVKYTSFSNGSTPAKSILYGFSLLGLFGLDEEIDSELKLINTIKKGLLHLQVIM